MNNDIENTIIKFVIKYINKDLNIQDININETINNYGVNSLSYIKLLVAIEKEFNMEFDEIDDSNNIDTISKLAKYVLKKI